MMAVLLFAGLMGLMYAAGLGIGQFILMMIKKAQ